MDYSMPMCDGPDATIAIRKYFETNAPHVNRPYICCVTAYDMNESYKKRALEAGMNRFASKFITCDDLKQIVKNLGIEPVWFLTTIKLPSNSYNIILNTNIRS